MIKPAIPVDEAARLSTLRSLNILDTLPEERLDRLTRMARRMLGVPNALISLVDDNRQWFKSCQGRIVSETPRNISFCGHAIFSGLGERVQPTVNSDLEWGASDHGNAQRRKPTNQAPVLRLLK